MKTLNTEKKRFYEYKTILFRSNELKGWDLVSKWNSGVQATIDSEQGCLVAQVRRPIINSKGLSLK